MLKVSPERWRQAQEWELETWRREQPASPHGPMPRLKNAVKRLLGRQVPGARTADEGDDWNIWWAEQFDGYAMLPSTFENAIELGCGPYTNLRLILKGRSAGHAVCSDPLVKEYVSFSGRWLAEAWRARRVMIDDHPIEECPFATDCFDLTVMNNVLDHVQDALKCLQEAVRITKPGGHLVLGQDLSDDDDRKTIGFDLGHPIMLDQAVLDGALLPSVSPLYYRILPREQGRNPSAHCGTYLLIGAVK